METYPLSFTALKGFQNLPAQGDLIVYESANVALNAETRVRVKPDSGGEVWLKPGQWFRATQMVTNWSIKSFNGNDVIDAFFVIGSGDFGDANTLNKFTLDATFANNVAVTNTGANPVPVSIQNAQVEITNDAGNRIGVTLDTAQTIPVSIAGTVNVAGTTVNYTNAFADAGTAAQVAQVVFTPAQNPNGAYLEFAEIAVVAYNVGTGYSFSASLIAKAGAAPASSVDGDVLLLAVCETMASYTYKSTTFAPTRIKIAAGKGLYLNQTANCTSATKTVLYTLL